MLGRNNHVKRVNLFEQVFIKEKLNNVYGALVGLCIALVFGYLIANQTLVGYSLFAGIVGFFVLLLCLFSVEWGLYVNIIYAFFGFHLSRYLFRDQFPVGVITDALIFATFLGLFVRRVNLRKKFSDFVKTPVVVCILILLFYLFIELFNTQGHTFEGWFQGFRRFLISVFLLFISFAVLDDYRKIMNYFKVILVLSVITGLYACIQQWHGLFGFEMDWVTSDKNRFGLYYINGNFRKFSTMSDPTAFGILMAASAVFFIVFTLYQKKALHIAAIFVSIIIMVLGMAYSGTRTANVMLAAGIAIYILLTLHKKSTRLFAVVAVLGYFFLMNVPIYDNPTLNRFRTSFSASKDESFLVREKNRNFIQPLIQSHPIGFGMGTVGGGGSKYAPNHFLAGFPPDSGYLKKAIETGWIGLALVCFLYFVIMRTAIRNYFYARQERYKVIHAGCVATLFAFFVAEFPQEAIGQISDIMFYYPLIAITLNLRYLEAAKNERGNEVVPVT